MIDKKTPIDQKLFDLVMRNTAATIAQQLVSVQPMPSNTFTDLIISAKTEEELRAAGYEPVSQDTRIMWVKKDNQ
jgi:hypothetical protein